MHIFEYEAKLASTYGYMAFEYVFFYRKCTLYFILWNMYK